MKSPGCLPHHLRVLASGNRTERRSLRRHYTEGTALHNLCGLDLVERGPHIWQDSSLCCADRYVVWYCKRYKVVDHRRKASSVNTKVIVSCCSPSQNQERECTLSQACRLRPLPLCCVGNGRERLWAHFVLCLFAASLQSEYQPSPGMHGSRCLR